MKPSRKPAVKVTVTISQENMPQWYEFLKNIDSGHVRAAVLRAHLKHPGESAVFRQPRTAPASLPQESDETPQEHTPAAPISSPASQARLESPSLPATPAGSISTSPATARGGLASAMLRAGQAPRW